MKKGKPFNKEIKEFEEEVIQIDRVTRVVKGGRRLRFRATVVVGNKKGKVGLGIGKSTEVTGAISKAIAKAKKEMIEIPFAGQTIPHKVTIKYKASRLLLMPAIPGTGIKAGGSVRKVVELAGIKDIMAKRLGTNNRLANGQATIKALQKLQAIPWLKVKPSPSGNDIEQKAAVKNDNRGQRKFNPNRRNFAAKKFNNDQKAAKPVVKEEKATNDNK